jgi:rhamnogalacturonyl hydrolase YesR
MMDVLSAASENDYAGFSKFDALNSPFLKALSLNNRWLRLIFTQAVMRCPLHIRPLLGVKKSRNPKGIALFARAYLFLFEATKNRKYLDEAENLIRWLADNSSPNQRHLCWGYNFIWQNTIFLQDIYEPNVVVTVFVGEAFIHAYRVTKNKIYLVLAQSVADFILHDVPKLYESKDELAIAYVLRNVDAAVLNNNVLTGAFLIKLWSETKDDLLRTTAEKLLNYTVNRRTDYYAWFYTHPAEKSPIKHDNYHTGGILDGLLEYFEETGDQKYMDVYWKGLEYYKDNLFETNGAPRWMNDKRFPYDIHSAAQGIITFAKAAKYKKQYIQWPTNIADWAIENLYRPATKDFAYRRAKFIKWNYSLMRWCNAWMARAMGEVFRRSDNENS